MGLEIGMRVAQLRQGSDEDIHIRGKDKTCASQAEAEARAKELSKSDELDAVVVKDEDGKFSVYTVDEIGKLDPDGNQAGHYQIHDFEANLVSFAVTRRDAEGQRIGQAGDESVFRVESPGKSEALDINFSIPTYNARPHEPAPPQGRLLPSNAAKVNENELLQLSQGEGKLWAVGEWHPERKPLILVHGIHDDFQNVQHLIDQFKDAKPPRQIYVFAYDDNSTSPEESGKQLAAELNHVREAYGHLNTPAGAKPELDIVAHSMGGIVARRALNELTAGPAPQKHIQDFGKINFIAADTPWEGFVPHFGSKPPDILRYVPGMPDPDMSSHSPMFKGTTDEGALHQAGEFIFGADSDTERQGLYGVDLPANVNVELVTADDNADLMWDYTDVIAKLDPETLPKVAEALCRAGNRDLPQDERQAALQQMMGIMRQDFGTVLTSRDRQLANGLMALTGSSDWPRVSAQIQQLLAQGQCTPEALTKAISLGVPRFAGHHADGPGRQGVLQNPDFLKHVSQVLDQEP